MTFPRLWSEDIEARVRLKGRNLDEQERPDHIELCTKCVVSTQRPRIVFDEEGVCSACRFAERKRMAIDWEKRHDELSDLLNQHRRKSGYDVIVPCSGGKDSATVAHKLKHEHGMHPLCVTWAPFIYTDIGRRNFENFVHSGFDVVTATPNGLIMRRLGRLSFEFYGDQWQPFAYGQLCWPMRASVSFGVPLVMFGENGEAEYGGDPSADDKRCWDYEDWDRVYLKGANVDRLVDLGKSIGALTDQDERDVSPFFSLPQREILKNAEFHWWSYYNFWHPQANYYHAVENTGFEANTERSEGTYSKYASLDDKLDGLHYFMAFVKFGIGRATSDAAHEVRDRDITRDEAIVLVKRFDGEFPKRYFAECVDYLGIDEEHFWEVVKRFARLRQSDLVSRCVT